MTLDLDAIEARVNAATDGSREADGAGSIWQELDNDDDRCLYHHMVYGTDNDHFADAEFIAHAREDVPALVARVRELEAAMRSFVFIAQKGEPLTQSVIE